MSSGECRMFSTDLSNHMERAQPSVPMLPYIPTGEESKGKISDIRPVENLQEPTDESSKTMYINDSFVLDTIPLHVDKIIDMDDTEDII